jgi:hypothetical protein
MGWVGGVTAGFTWGSSGPALTAKWFAGDQTVIAIAAREKIADLFDFKYDILFFLTKAGV